MDDDKGWLDDATRAITLEPTNAAFYVNRAVAKWYLKDWAGRVSDYEKAVALDPNNQEYKGKLSTAKYDLSLDKEEKSHPKAYALFQSGLKKHMAKDYQGAITDFTEAIKADPQFAQAYNSRGKARGWLDDNQGWMEDETRAIAIDPTNAAFYESRAIAKYYLKDWAGQVLDYDKAVSLEPYNQTYIAARDSAKANLFKLFSKALDDGDVAKAEKLLGSAKIDLNLYHGYTLHPLLSWFAMEGNLEVVKFLVLHGANINGRAKGGVSTSGVPLVEAAAKGHQDIVEYLIAHGADINCKDWLGQTALHNATYPKHPSKSIEKLLIAKGADVTLKDDEGYTAFEWDKRFKDRDRKEAEYQAKEQARKEQEKAYAESRTYNKANNNAGDDASRCVFSSLGYTNNCDQTIQIDLHALSGSGGNFCTGEGVHTLYPHQTLSVPPSCVSFINLRGAIFVK
jgi:tetratricopeptide (TPR) repeat protein